MANFYHCFILEKNVPAATAFLSACFVPYQVTDSITKLYISSRKSKWFPSTIANFGAYLCTSRQYLIPRFCTDSHIETFLRPNSSRIIRVWSHEDEQPQFCLQINTLLMSACKLFQWKAVSTPPFSIFYDMNMQLPWLPLSLSRGKSGILYSCGMGEGWL